MTTSRPIPSRLVRLALATAALVVGCTGAPPFTTEDASRFDIAWTALLAHLESAHPEVDLQLRPPATDEAITAFEVTLGRELPGAVRALYRRADGQEGSGFQLFSTPFSGYRFLSLEEAADQRESMRDPRLLLLSFIPAEGDEGVRNRWWHPAWIPIGENGAGDLLVADRVPARGGLDGQLVQFIHDDTTRTRVASGITEYLEVLRTNLEGGGVVPYVEWRTFLPADQVPAPE